MCPEFTLTCPDQIHSVRYQKYMPPPSPRLEESGVLTDCSIQTQDADEVLDFDFSSANVVNRVIMKADGLREVFAELDTSSESLEILLSPSPPYCRLSTVGYAGTTQVCQWGFWCVCVLHTWFLIHYLYEVYVLLFVWCVCVCRLIIPKIQI